MRQLGLRKAAIFFYLIVNGFWALAAYVFHKVGVPLRAILFAVCIGVILGNLSAYAGVRFAAKVLSRRADDHSI